MIRLVPEQVARVCHEANRAYCLLLGDDPPPPWEDFGGQGGIIDGVKFVIANPDAGDDGQHKAWMDHKLLDGWRYGETLDRQGKRHPNLVAFEDLPEEQQRKDRLFRAVVLALLGE